MTPGPYRLAQVFAGYVFGFIIYFARAPKPRRQKTAG
jgi:hypothetical protein